MGSISPIYFGRPTDESTQDEVMELAPSNSVQPVMPKEKMIPSQQRSRSIVGLAAFLLGAPASAQPATLVSEDYYVAARDPGIQLYVRNKRPHSMATFAPDRILLFVHGATYPSETSFDLQLADLSWMDYIALRGYDVYLMDVRGYGRSTRPLEMNQLAIEHGPIVNTDIAVKDFGVVVEHILTRRGVSRITLLGWSWGTVIAAA